MKHTLLLLALMNIAAFAAEKIPLPAAHTTRHIEGWTVRVDDRLLKGQHAAVGERALKLLESRLVAITFVVPEMSLAKLRAITIELDFGSDDFYPFVSGELMQAEPEIFALLADIWGPLPGSAPPKPEAKDGTQAERVAKITKQLSRAGKLPGQLLDAHFVEEQTGEGMLGPSDFKAFYALSVAPADLPAWRAGLSKVKT